MALARGHFDLAETLDGHLSATEARGFYLQRIGAIYGVSISIVIYNPLFLSFTFSRH